MISSDNLNNQLTCFAWNTTNGQGRLKQIKAGTSSIPNSLLDLRYYTGTDTPEYDAVGNINHIYDYKMGSPQTQTFTYDNLDRLTSAQATGGTNGNYASESYIYNTTTGNLSTKAGVTYTLRRAQGRLYGDSNHAHAVTSLSNGNAYSHDSNGNQVSRYVGGINYRLSHDVENRLVSVSWTESSQSRSMTFVFDGDGNRVKSTLAIGANSTTTTFVGTYYEVTGSSITKYYYATTARVAMRSSVGLGLSLGTILRIRSGQARDRPASQRTSMAILQFLPTELIYKIDCLLRVTEHVLQVDPIVTLTQSRPRLVVKLRHATLIRRKPGCECGYAGKIL